MNTVRNRKRFDIVNYLPIILALVAVAVIVAIIVAVFSGGGNEIKKNQLLLMDISAQSNYKTFADGIVYIDGEKGELYYVDDRGEKMWGFAGAQEEMLLCTSNKSVGVFLGKKLQVINSDGTLSFSKEFEKNIADVSLGENIIAVKLNLTDEIIILNKKGDEIDRISSNVNCTNIRFGVYADNSVWVISVENSAYKPEYQISTYKYTTEKTQTVSFREDSQMIYDAVFNSNLCYIFGTERILARDCDYTGAINVDYVVNGFEVSSFGIIDKQIHVLLLGEGRLKAIGGNGVSDIALKEKINFAVVANKEYYGFSNYFMYKIKPNGKSTQYKFPVRVDKVVQGNNYVLIQSGDSLYRYGLEG
ncbi:MAG: hypothetical protein IKB86_02165 [Clostridia bacterium]|nr:hypothetical protein [Clostridia bacterium]